MRVNECGVDIKGELELVRLHRLRFPVKEIFSTLTLCSFCIEQ